MKVIYERLSAKGRPVITTDERRPAAGGEIITTANIEEIQAKRKAEAEAQAEAEKADGGPNNG